jgi:hypothetical protein
MPTVMASPWTPHDTAIVRDVADQDDLAGGPFSFVARADGSVLVRYRQAPVTVLRGKAAERFVARVSTADADAAQQLMARVTGNFKRGNER